MTQLTEALYDQYSNNPFTPWYSQSIKSEELKIQIGKTDEKSFLIIEMPKSDYNQCQFEIYNDKNYEYCGELVLENNLQPHLTCPYQEDASYFIKIILNYRENEYLTVSRQRCYPEARRVKKYFKFFPKKEIVTGF